MLLIIELFKTRMNMIQYLNYKSILIVAGILFVVKSLLSIFYMPNFAYAEDWSIAMNLLTKGTYSLYDTAEPTAMKTPVYPLFIYSIISICGASKLAVVIVQNLLAAISGILLFKLSARIFSERISFVIALLFMLHPSYFYYSNVIEVTNIFVPLSILSTILYAQLLKDLSNLKILNLIIAAAVFAVTMLCQPITAPIFVVAIGYLIIKKHFALVAKLSIIMALVFSPWVIRNYIEFNKFIPTKTPFWMNIYLGYLDFSHGNERFSIVPDSTIQVIRQMRNDLASDVAMEAKYKEISIKAISQSPILYAEKTLWQAVIYWLYPPRYFDDASISFLFIRKIPVYGLNLLLIISLYYAFRRDRKVFFTALSVLLFFTIVYSLTSSANIRYKLDIEWLQFILLGYPIKAICERYYWNR